LLECLRRPSKSHPRKWLASNATCVVSTDAMSALTPCCCHALKHSPNCVFIYGRRQQGAAEKAAAARVAAGKVLAELWAAAGALQARRLADDSGLPQITRPFDFSPSPQNYDRSPSPQNHGTEMARRPQWVPPRVLCGVSKHREGDRVMATLRATEFGR
jgi:hypothetical protein